MQPAGPPPEGRRGGPCPALDRPTRQRMGAAALRAALACGYTGAGTVEFLLPADERAQFLFMELNARLQVEHPVTEMVTGLDLVEQQLRIAAGESLGLVQDDVVVDGHALEARVYAEDPARGFLPTGGTVLAHVEPVGPGIRVDGGIAEGTAVGSHYDPLLAKVVAHGPDRPTALARLDRALRELRLLGVTTNVAFLRALLGDRDVRAGRLDTGLAERLPAAGLRTVPDEVLPAAALAGLGPLAAPTPDGHRGAGRRGRAGARRPGGRHGPAPRSDGAPAVTVRRSRSTRCGVAM
ncbi:MAG TPA: hypothetical protein VG452_03625 [Egibacteraceae bacterium]|nr:hypothetical protein [Egibacteraceae bacterium]